MREMEKRKLYIITCISACIAIFLIVICNRLFFQNETEKKIKVGFVYVDDASTAYTYNFIKAQKTVEKEYEGNIETAVRYNVAEGDEEGAIRELAESGCDLIFSTSYGYGETAKRIAQEYPDIQFCQATCSNANDEPMLENYHTFMGEIYEGRYVSGVAAGLKLQELIEEGLLTPQQAKIGYVAAYPYAEVISGYTAFFLGVRSIVPDAVMTVKYTNSWNDYTLEKKYAAELIEEGCVLISQHSDTAGPAVACEETDASRIVYHVGYNESMADVAPTTYLIGCKINWTPYVRAAVAAVRKDEKIEDCVDGHVHGQDTGAGFEAGWVEMLELNRVVATIGTDQKIQETIDAIKQGKIHVFQGDYVGVNAYDETDILDLNDGYEENADSSAPTFSYVLKDVITVE